MKIKAIWLVVLLVVHYQAKAQKMFTAEVKGHGPQVILIHGLYCSGEVWKETVAHYEGKYEFHILTLAGFGGNPARLSGRFLEEVKDEVIAYAKKLHKPVLIGHSMGAFISYWAAAGAPGVFEKVIAVDGVPFLPELQTPGATPETTKPMALGIKTQMQNQTPAQIEEGQKKYLPYMITSTARVEQVAKIAAKADPATQGEVMYELFTLDLRKTVATIDCPVLLLGTWIAYKDYGATHESVEKAEKGELAAIKNVTVELSDTARHFIFYDDPDWFYGKVDEFLNRK